MPASLVKYTYLLCDPGDLRRGLDYLVYLLTPHKRRFGTIVVSGHSGALMGGLLAVALNKRLFIARKRYMWGGKTQGFISPRYIIVDDFIQHGSTIDNMLREVNRLDKPFVAKCVGIFLYVGKPLLTEYRGIPVNCVKTRKQQ